SGLRKLALESNNGHPQPGPDLDNWNFSAFCCFIRSIAPQPEILPTRLGHRQCFGLVCVAIPLHLFPSRGVERLTALSLAIPFLKPIISLSVSSGVHMTDFLVDFTWYRDPKGYRIAAFNHLNLPWRLPQDDPWRCIVPLGRRRDLIRYQPFARGGDLCLVFAEVTGPDQLLR